MKVKLFKHINGELKLVDYGVVSMAAVYVKRGYYIEIVKNDDNERVWYAPKPARVVVIRRQEKPKRTLFGKIKDFVQSLIPEPCFA